MRAKLESIRLSGQITALMVCLAMQGILIAADLPTREVVLSEVYPGARWNARRLFLSEEQLAAVQAEAGSTFESPLVARYDLISDGKMVGRAYIDTHLVRSKKQSLLICFDAEGTVARVETTAFLEPPEYRPSPQWFKQFNGLDDSSRASLGNGIRPAAGATLSAIATTQAVRRVIALDQLLSGESPKRRAE